jgi:class 3 adenylate cyclase
MADALARHDALLRHAIQAHQGWVFETIGDQCCAAFASPTPALFAAVEAQRALIAEPWEPTGPLRVRMALRTGPAQEREGNYFGPPVNRVARPPGDRGQLLLSRASAHRRRVSPALFRLARLPLIPPPFASTTSPSICPNIAPTSSFSSVPTTIPPAGAPPGVSAPA